MKLVTLMFLALAACSPAPSGDTEAEPDPGVLCDRYVAANNARIQECGWTSRDRARCDLGPACDLADLVALDAFLGCIESNAACNAGDRCEADGPYVAPDCKAALNARPKTCVDENLEPVPCS